MVGFPQYVFPSVSTTMDTLIKSLVTLVTLIYMVSPLYYISYRMRAYSTFIYNQISPE